MGNLMYPEGYRWRNELLDKLMHYIKKGIKDGFPDEKGLRIFLNNLLRKYIPTFWPTRLHPNKNNGVEWILPLSLNPNRDWWGKEIKCIGRKFAEVSSRLDSDLAKEIFRDNGWEIEKPVEGISLWDKRGRWRYDAYKDKIAVEVELSSRSSVFKDTFKFLIGQATGQIEIGIIMVRNQLEKDGQPYLGWIDPSSHPIFTTLPMLQVAFHGFPNQASDTTQSYQVTSQ